MTKVYCPNLSGDYKIIAKILANIIKPVLVKLISENQKGLVGGRNIHDANRLIQDIIDYPTSDKNLDFVRGKNLH